MFILINNGIAMRGKITLDSNRLNVFDSVLSVENGSYLGQENLQFFNNEIIFNDQAVFIDDRNEEKLNLYPNIQQNSLPRVKTDSQDQAVLFIDEFNNLCLFTNENVKQTIKEGTIQQ